MSTVPWNITTTTVKVTSTFPTQMTSIETSTIVSTTSTTTTKSSSPMTTTVTLEEETTKANIEDNKSYEFQSNFSRNNDSVFVTLHSNVSNANVSINNTFTSIKNDNSSCEILFNEQSMQSNKIINTKILINFNGSMTRELAIQLGDRFIDIADLLLTVHSVANGNNSIKTV
ncbi:unnamed protein product [Adineta steineri]|uniref:Uncharacterized protein n=1 Tax=Adineta steineri TaxID=433720 RepID=A0A819ZFS1_9BILA|nr:unnamed protein product [Adineta steineri]CAF3676119.1 unnamed protein product [Adineta steineri]CAF4173565.1 unnamed protein product [Adineta steineri]